MLSAGVTDLLPEDSVFHQFVKQMFGQPVDAGSRSAQQAAAEATTGFQPVQFAAASTGEFHCFAWYSQCVRLHTSERERERILHLQPTN